MATPILETASLGEVIVAVFDGAGPFGSAPARRCSPPKQGQGSS